MMHETLFRETFSQLHASDEAKREVLSMIKRDKIDKPGSKRGMGTHVES